MEKIKLAFDVTQRYELSDSMVVVLTLDETGKNCKLKYKYPIFEIVDGLSENQDEKPLLPKRVLAAFTENTINKILSKDEIPNESGLSVLDGTSYEITITKGDICKKYYADDVSIETYPLLRYLASWCRK